MLALTKACLIGFTVAAVGWCSGTDYWKTYRERVARDIGKAAELIAAAGSITVLTGAGISTDSGIPDFRGPAGAWTKDPDSAKYVDIDYYVNDPAIRRESWRRRGEHPAWTAEPNRAHRALAELATAGRLRWLLTQNIDGLHQRAGVPAEQVIELHGSITETVCLGCGDRRPMAETLDRVRAGDTDPACLLCGGMLKSGTVFFGEMLDPDRLDTAARAVTEADVLIAIGTSLQVHPVAGLVPRAVGSGVPVVIVNAEPTPYDDLATAVVREPIGEAVPRLVAAISAGRA